MLGGEFEPVGGGLGKISIFRGESMGLRGGGDLFQGEVAVFK